MQRKRVKKKNQGNSYIMVVATISFLAVLVAAILVAVALCYRLKAYDINARDNFYYLEQAMDEIYAGVGADSMKVLNQAYDETLEVMVYYDTKTRSYVTMEPDAANKILKTTYMKMLQADANYATQADVEARLKSFLSYPWDGTTEPGKEGVQLSVGNVVKNDDDLTICNLILKREAKYSTVNARSGKDSGGSVAAPDTFIQTLTTDLVVGKPEFDVNFNANNADISELYAYSMVADCGIEIADKDGKPALGNKVNITGNVYAASDFYNKNYNENPGTLPTVNNVATKVEKEQMLKVNSYDEKRLQECNGVNVNSMYSGFYVDGATVVMASDRIVVPGAFALMNCADVTISNIANSSIDYADVWADGIVLDGFALRQSKTDDLMKGATLNMKARAYIYDDLEVNANSGSVLLNGEYYGYNYASTDNRTYTTASIDNGIRRFTKDTHAGITDGQAIEGQAHYNSSAIILNGQDTTLDFKQAKALYVAGQSYIEVSKHTRESATEETLTYTVKNGGVTEDMTDTVKREIDSYLTPETKNGAIANNYTVYSGKTAEADKTPIQDYRTGEAISIKSNQLAYLPEGTVHDDKDGLWLELPKRLQQVDAYKGIWSNLDKIPVVKTVVSGKIKYFLDFSKADIKDKNVMNEFIADYAAMFDESTIAEGSGKTAGEAYGLVDITDYDYFKVKMLKVSDSTTEPYQNIYTNSAITTLVDGSFTIVANSGNADPLIKAATNINNAINEANNGSTLVGTSGDAPVIAQRVSSKLQDQYKEVKWTLSNKSTDGDAVNDAHAMKEEVITPINYYFNFELVNSDNSRYCALKNGYGVWVSDGDVHVGATECKIESMSTVTYDKAYKNGKVKGIILAKGDVTFDDNVTEFEGLIVTGGKIIVNNFNKSKGKTTMSFLANEEIIKSVLRECDSSRGESKANNFGFVCDIFRLFTSQYVDPTGKGDTPVVSMKDISAVQFEDILSFRNWKKNVD